ARWAAGRDARRPAARHPALSLAGLRPHPTYCTQRGSSPPRGVPRPTSASAAGPCAARHAARCSASATTAASPLAAGLQTRNASRGDIFIEQLRGHFRWTATPQPDALPSRSLTGRPSGGLHGSSRDARPPPSPDYSRTVKEKSHRVARRCYRSGVWTLRGTQTRRLDGHRLYSPADLPLPWEFATGHRRVRHSAREFGWRRDAPESRGSRAGADDATRRVPGGSAPAGKSAA